MVLWLNRTMEKKEEIGSPYRFPILGHTPYLLGAFPSGKIHRIAQERGGIWRVSLPNSSFIAVTSFELIDELCDEDRFEKSRIEFDRNRITPDAFFSSRLALDQSLLSLIQTVVDYLNVRAQFNRHIEETH